MLAKLIKYDVKSTWRDFAGIYLAILLGVIIVPLVIRNIDNIIVNTAVGIVAFGIVVSVVVITVISLFKIYNTNIFSREGYLTMTLPVTPTKIVISKLVVSTMWIVLTGIVSLIGMIIFSLIMSPGILYDMVNGVRYVFDLWEGQSMFGIVLFIVLIILFMILSIVKEVAKLFLSCSIAHLRQLNKFRVPVGILSFFVFTWIESVLVQGLSRIFKPLLPNSELWYETMDHTFSIEKAGQLIETFNVATGLGILYTLAMIVVFSFGTVWILNHKLDLD
ncbi:MAG: hypothetical protein CVU86_04755 [Firmicutes bacterium HGW-Firmicutes-11]|jgi:hypothetical protein|nr:MAG: hypothetical protein CVU86_04755 [Firmicutes bacterium HGW-Firmicutes-11]